MDLYIPLGLIVLAWIASDILKRVRRRRRAASALADVKAAQAVVAAEAARWGAERHDTVWTTANTDVTVILTGPKLHLTVTVRGRPSREAAMREACGILASRRLFDAKPFRPGGDPSDARPNPPPPPPPPREPWRVVLGLERGDGLAEAEAARRRLAMANHPDRGGSPEAMARINAAMDEARRALG